MLLNIERARSRLATDHLDAWACVLPKNVYYLSDYESEWLFDLPWAACAILPRDPSLPATLVVHDVELTNLAEKPSWMPELHPYFAAVNGRTFPHYAVEDRDSLNELEKRVLMAEERWSDCAAPSCLEATCNSLKTLGLERARIGFDDLRFRDACSALLPGIQGSDAMTGVLYTRQIKTPAEIALLRESARRNQLAIEAALREVQTGALWSDVRRAYSVAAARVDCVPASFFVGAGRKSMGLWADHDYPIRAGEPVCLDAMLTYRRYFGDAQRTVVIDRPSVKLEKYWAAVSTAAQECYAEMRPGVKTGDLRERAIGIVRKLGIPGFRHAFVHGLGLDHLELPGEGRAFSTFTLETGMVVNMDLEVCELGFGGVYYERTMLITPRGSESFYSMPQSLTRLH